jgi:hypothetical protein
MRSLRVLPIFSLYYDRKDDLATWYFQAIARLGDGDRAYYREICLEMLKPQRFGAPRSAGEASLLIYAVAPLTKGLDGEAILRIGRMAVGPSGGNERVLSAACYRAGRYQDVVQNYRLALHHGLRPRAWDLLFRAMAHHHLKQAALARSALARARYWVAEADRVEITPTEMGEVRWLHWMERVEVHALLREAEALIGN